MEPNSFTLIFHKTRMTGLIADRTVQNANSAATMGVEAKNRVIALLQEKFHRGIIKGVRNISAAP